MRQRKTDRKQNVPGKVSSDRHVSGRPSTRDINCITLLVVGCLVLLIAVSAFRPGSLETHVNLQKQTRRVLATTSRRFPRYGTQEFNQQCGWTLSKRETPARDCTFRSIPRPSSSEGIAEWVSQIAMGFISVKLVGCNFLLDYGKHVNLGQVVQPHSPPSRYEQTEMVPMNWTVPSGFSCSRKKKGTCIASFASVYMRKLDNTTILDDVPIPFYRSVYQSGALQRRSHLGLEEKLEGFRLETGMACSLGSLLDLAPSASQFQPGLFTRILPTLRDERALTIAIYLRTGHTDQVARAEKEGKELAAPDKMAEAGGDNNEKALECALGLEAQYLTRNEGGEESKTEFTFDRIVWMVVTDLPPLKDYITEKYTNSDVNHDMPMDKRKWKSRVIPRQIVTTTSRGVHTKTQRDPSTADFAEAFIDWYLVGESDLVITSFPWYTFGGTAALRTARPFYDGRTCLRLVSVDNNMTAA